MTTKSLAGSAVGTASAEGSVFIYGRSGLLDPIEETTRLLAYLPSYMQDGPHIRNIFEVLGRELQRAMDATREVELQLNLATATWGLTWWEQMTGLPMMDSNPDYETRRALVFATLYGGRDESEFYFVQRITSLVGDVPTIFLLDPTTHPYEMAIQVPGVLAEAAPSTAVVAGYNLLLDNTASFETSVAGISASNYVTLAQSSLHPVYGTKTCEATSTQAGYGGIAASLVTITGGKSYTFRSDVYNAAATRDARMTIDWYNGATYLSSSYSPALSAVAGDNHFALTAAAPASATKASSSVELSASAAGQKAYFDGVSLSESAYPGFVGTGSTLSADTYTYKVTFVFDSGETDEGASISTPLVVPANKNIAVSLPLSSSSDCRGRNIYRRKAGTSSSFILVGQVSDNYTTYFVDTTATASGASVPTTNTAATLLKTRLEDLIESSKPAHIKHTLDGSTFRADISRLDIDDL